MESNSLNVSNLSSGNMNIGSNTRINTPGGGQTLKCNQCFQEKGNIYIK